MTKNDFLCDIQNYQPASEECAFWWLGQQSFVLKFKNATCYLDPFLSPLPGRLFSPLLEPSDIQDADFILGTHDHADHIDRTAWPALAKASPRAIFIVPALLRERLARELKLPLERLAGVDHEKSFARNGIKISGVPAAHEFLDRDPATGLHPYLGYVIEFGGLAVYQAGDTCRYEGMRDILKRWTLDVAFLPINGRDAKRLAANIIGNMTFQEAADLAGELEPGLTVPAHFDMFAANSEDPQKFVDYMRMKYPRLKTYVPVRFERMVVAKR